MSFVNNPALFLLPPLPTQFLRPPALIRAGQAGQSGWRRDRDLPRLLGRDTLPPTPVALRLLRAGEAHLDAARRERRADYDMRRHVRFMIALLAEMHAADCPAPSTADPSNRSNVLAFTGRGKTPRARRA